MISRVKRLALVPMSLLALVSCTDSYEYDAPAVDTAGIYLAASKTQYLFGEGELQTFSFDVLRHDSLQAHTYRLEVSDNTLGIPTEVSFAAGESCKTVSVTCNLPMPTYDYTVTITPAQGEAYIYGNPSIDLTMTLARKVNGRVLVYPMYFEERPREIYELGTREDSNRLVSTYMVKDMYSDGYNVRLTVDEDGLSAIEYQPALMYVVGVGTPEYLHYIEGSGAYNEVYNTLEYTLTFTVEGLGFFQSGIASEVLYFPSDYNPVPAR